MSRTERFLHRLAGRAVERQEPLTPQSAALEKAAPALEAPGPGRVVKGRAARWPSDIAPSASGFWGRIDNVDAGVVRGWMFSPREEVSPVLLVGGKPARLMAWPLPRPEVQRALGSPHRVGFKFRLDGAAVGDGWSCTRSTAVRSSCCTRGSSNAPRHAEPAGTAGEAAQLAADPSCVAITCWESAHNPVGRARVLYDVARTRGPAVIFSYRLRSSDPSCGRP